MDIGFTPDDRVALASKALDELMDKYRVDIMYDENNEYFFVEREYNPEKPILKIV